MKVLVLTKSVPKTDTRVQVANGQLNESEFAYELNPYDEFAIEAALRLKDARDCEVSLLTLGPDRCEQDIRKGLAMGADDAYLLSDDRFFGGDASSVSKALAAACRHIGFDLILAGKQSIDEDQGQVGIRVATLLGIPHVGVAVGLDVADDGSTALCRSEVEGGQEEVAVGLPAVITCQKGLGEPRFASLPGIMKAKRKPLTHLTPEELGLSADDIGASGARSSLVSYEAPPVRGDGKMVEGADAAEQATRLAQLLRDEAKAI